MINLIKNKNNSLPQQVNENKLNIDLLNKLVIIPMDKGYYYENSGYNQWDIVHDRNGLFYICLKSYESDYASNIDLDNTTYWCRITGEKGEQGIQGPQGPVMQYINRGESVLGSSYNVGDIVYKINSLDEPIYYLCIHYVESQNIPVYEDTTNWVRLTGYQGDMGPVGPSGHEGMSPSLRYVTITQISSGSPYGEFILVDGENLIYDLKLYLTSGSNITIHNTGVMGDANSVYSTQFMNQAVMAIQNYINNTYTKTITEKDENITNIRNTIITSPRIICTVPMNSVIKQKYTVHIAGLTSFDRTFEVEYNNYNTNNTLKIPIDGSKLIMLDSIYAIEILYTPIQNNDKDRTVSWEFTAWLYNLTTAGYNNVPTGSTIKIIDETVETKQNMNLFGQ